jgi:murein L,D-transpeptidase YafK
MLCVSCSPTESDGAPLPAKERVADVRQRVEPSLIKALEAKKLKLGQKVFLRSFKESKEMEVWLQSSADKPWTLFKNYRIATYGKGTLGPKLKQGDGQAPEGIYPMTADSLHPGSKYHLAINTGYPNAYDRAHKRTGDYLMIHGKAVSIGCFAMTDAYIEEIYLLLDAAFTGGQKSITLHSFPFRMTPERMANAAKDSHPALSFWQELQPIYDSFEKSQRVPHVDVEGKKYVLRS